MTAPISRAAVLEILRTPAASDTFPDMIRRVEALEGVGVGVKALIFSPFQEGGCTGRPYPFQYFITQAHNGRFLCHHDETWHDSLQAAQENAQEHYQNAALEPVAQPETGPGELLPCPFCGEAAESHNYIVEGAVRCVGCPAAVVRQHSQFSEDDGLIAAIAAWNRRATREPGTEPTPGQFTTMCLAIEDVITGRGFDVDPWQPIETAPKDGLIDIWLAEGKRWCDCYYDRICDEWRTSRPSGRLVSVKSQHVTHWMPLPKPPGETTSAILEEVKAYLRNALMVGGWKG